LVQRQSAIQHRAAEALMNQLKNFTGASFSYFYLAIENPQKKCQYLDRSFVAYWSRGGVNKRKPIANVVICDNLVYRRPKMLEQTQGRAFCSNACYGMYCKRDSLRGLWQDDLGQPS